MNIGFSKQRASLLLAELLSIIIMSLPWLVEVPTSVLFLPTAPVWQNVLSRRASTYQNLCQLYHTLQKAIMCKIIFSKHTVTYGK